MIYLSLDLDAFYCAVEERYDPTLKGEAFCVYQKQVVCTLSYSARAMGIKKLANAQQVRNRYPNMRMINGESLSRYRAAGTMLIGWLRKIIKSPIERLGLEELRCEISPAIAKIVAELDLAQLAISSDLPDEAGDGIKVHFYETELYLPDFFFGFNGKSIPAGFDRFSAGRENIEYYLAGHIAQYIQEKMKLDTGYSCSIGVGSSISLAKIACGVNKPYGVTVLWPGYEQEFLNRQSLRKVPGFGSKTILNLANYGVDASTTIAEFHSKVPKEDFVKIAPGELYELSWCREKTQLVDWQLPSQVSVEETWATPLVSSQVPEEVEKLVDSLLSQAQLDIVVDGVWQAIPTHVRVAVIKYRESGRQSRSQKLTGPSPNAAEFPKEVRRLASRLAAELVKDPVRLINIALLFPSSN